MIIITRDFNATRDKVWESFTDGVILAKWWGPKDWPASTVSFDFKVGGHWHYFMTGPDGTEAHGCNDYTAIDAPNSISLFDSFCDEKDVKNTTLPSTKIQITFADLGDSTKVTVEMKFASEADMQKLIDMGFEPGFTNSLDNLEVLLSK